MSTGSRVPRVVLAFRPTAFDLLRVHHATVGQLRFFLKQRGQSLDALRARHEEQETALLAAEAAIPSDWRRARVPRRLLDRFLFEPDDLVVAVGQDGLVANLAKYLDGQPVIGINPSPGLYEGVLVPHLPEAIGSLLAAAARGRIVLEARTMVEATLDDGQRLCALNEIFLGHVSHQSARYRLRDGGAEERQSSSGLIVASGTGSTGWARSIHRERQSPLELPAPTDPELIWFVREAWPSVATGVDHTQGLIDPGASLDVTSEMEEGGVVFGDGIEADRLDLAWGQQVSLRRSERALQLVCAGGVPRARPDLG